MEEYVEEKYGNIWRKHLTNTVRLIGKTLPVTEDLTDLNELIAYQTKVSNLKSQDNMENAQKLLKYCADHQHWSPFEMGNLVMEITTTRDISRQILRHRSFSFQEFSQRYSKSENYTIQREARLQDLKNRQNSIEHDDEDLQHLFQELQAATLAMSVNAYNEALQKGIAKEQARVLLPEGLTETKMYMNGTIRSWIHYVKLRCGNGTQKEHMEIARQCRDILLKELPVLKEILDD